MNETPQGGVPTNTVVAQAIRDTQPRLKIEVDPHRDGVLLIGMRSERNLDLSGLPDATRVTIEIKPSRRAEALAIKGPRASCAVVITIPEVDNGDALERLMFFQFEGHLELNVGNRRLMLRAAESRGILRCAPGGVVKVGLGFDTDELELHLEECEAHLAAPVGKLWVSGNIELHRLQLTARGEPEFRSGTPTVETISLAGNTNLQLAPELRIANVIGSPGAGTTLNLFPSQTDIGTALGDWAELHVGRLQGVRLRVPTARSTVNSSGLHDCTIDSPLNLRFESESIVEGLHANVTVASGEYLRAAISAGPNSVLNDVTGEIKLADASHVHLAAGEAGLVVHQAPNRSKLVEKDTADWVGMDITGVTFPPGVVGRQVLANVSNVFHLSPDTRSVPGLDQTWAAQLGLPSKLAKRRASRPKPVDYAANPTRLRHDAEFTRELARLSKLKGATGSATTRLAWCSYRLRAMQADGFVERFSLRAYRLMGYGERPGPAFLTWALLAVVLASGILALDHREMDFSLQGLKVWGIEVGRLALGAFAGVAWGQQANTRDPIVLLEVVARVLISVPLVTGSLALRKYVKSGTED